MPKDVSFSLLKEQTAGSVREIIEKVYAKSYSNLALPTAGEAWAAHCRRDELVALAFAGKDVVGMVSLKRLPQNPRVYELGMLTVAEGYRDGKTAAGLLAAARREFPLLIDYDAVFMENVANHRYSQRKSAQNGGTDCAIAFSAMPALVGGTGRISFVTAFFEHPAALVRPVYIPRSYAEILLFFYQGLRARSFFPLCEDRPPSGESVFFRRKFPAIGLLKADCAEIGGDFAAKMRDMDAGAPAEGLETVEICLPLVSPYVSFAVDCLSARGYFLGGVYPFWFGGDGVMLQKCRAVDAASLRVYSAKAKKMLALLLRGRQGKGGA
ncbi:MAG: hypothetical protein LBO03_04725 [Acidaminococcales bacterium]|jgi:hypothetical protein|nr:hypothetical protein [Acidaminococcales bacterium]